MHEKSRDNLHPEASLSAWKPKAKPQPLQPKDSVKPQQRLSKQKHLQTPKVTPVQKPRSNTSVKSTPMPPSSSLHAISQVDTSKQSSLPCKSSAQAQKSNASISFGVKSFDEIMQERQNKVTPSAKPQGRRQAVRAKLSVKGKPVPKQPMGRQSAREELAGTPSSATRTPPTQEVTQQPLPKPSTPVHTQSLKSSVGMPSSHSTKRKLSEATPPTIKGTSKRQRQEAPPSAVLLHDEAISTDDVDPESSIADLDIDIEDDIDVSTLEGFDDTLDDAELDQLLET